MKIAFFGTFGSFDYFTIGGVESFARRLATGLTKEGHRADFVIYRAPVDRREKAPEGFQIHYFKGFVAAGNFLKEEYDHVLTTFVPLVDRLAYLNLRRRYRNRLRFHQIYFGWPELNLKRQMAYLDARLYPFNGRLFCVSPRLFREVSRWSRAATLLLPPVPEEYFLKPQEKSRGDKIRVTYIGRTENGKGIETVLELFDRLKNRTEVELAIHGFQIPQSRAGKGWHEWLSNQSDIPYTPSAYRSYTPEVEENLRRILQATDVLILPYQRLSSTIDTPLLLLEGMASLCAIVTRPLGDLPYFYPLSPFWLKGDNAIDSVVSAILLGGDHLERERNKIYQRNGQIGFRANQTVINLINGLT